MVGLLPLCATTVVEPWQRERVPGVTTLFRERLRQMPELLRFIHPTGPGHLGVGERGIIALLTPERLRRVLSKMLDEGEFLSPYGIRSLSQVPRTASVRVPRRRAGIPRRVLAGGVGQRHVRRQLQLARADLVSGNALIIRALLQLLPVLRRQLHDRVPHWLRPPDEPFRGRQGDRGSPHAHFPAGRARQAARLRRDREVPVRPALARPPLLLRVLSRRQRRRARRQPSDGLDGTGGHAHPAVRGAGPPAMLEVGKMAAFGRSPAKT